MKKNLFGYNVAEADTKIQELTDHNELLLKRIEQQDEQIKELRARYAELGTIESKLISSISAMDSNIAAIEEALESVDTVSTIQQNLTDLSLLATDSAHSIQKAQSAIKDAATIFASAALDISKLYESATQSNETVLDAAATAVAILELTKQKAICPRSRNKQIASLAENLRISATSAARSDLPFQVQAIVTSLAGVDVNSLTSYLSAAREEISLVKNGSEQCSEKVIQISSVIQGSAAEVSDLHVLSASLSRTATKMGKLSSYGLANIERSRVASHLEQLGSNTSESVHVPVHDPQELIDNPSADEPLASSGPQIAVESSDLDKLAETLEDAFGESEEQSLESIEEMAASIEESAVEQDIADEKSDNEFEQLITDNEMLLERYKQKLNSSSEASKSNPASDGLIGA